MLEYGIGEGKLQLNPIPEIVKRMIKKDLNVVNRLKAHDNLLELDPRFWTFPKFRPIASVTKITDALNH